MDLSSWSVDAKRWLSGHTARRDVAMLNWGEGPDSVELFSDLTEQEEAQRIDSLRHWQRLKSDAGYGSINWPVRYGGAGLDADYERAFSRLENRFETPQGHEIVAITLDLIAPTILRVGTDDQRARYLRSMRRTDELWCQLFSEPAAGSDLASVSTRAVRSGGEWVLNGQKVWTSGARHADFGYALCRTDPAARRHAGLTAFIVPMHADGVEVRPLRQMTGGASFNEVFLADVRIPDTCRLGRVDAGWEIALVTLGFERASRSKIGLSGSELFARLVLAARHAARESDPIVRQRLMQVYISSRVRSLTSQRVAAMARAGGVPGALGSLSKLGRTESLKDVTTAASAVLGPGLVTDTGVWGTYSWSKFITGLPGLRIAGGTDEIQRNILAERVLGLPKEPVH